MILSPALLALAVMPALSPGQVESRATLSSLRHDYRPLLVFAASDNSNFREQMHLLAERTREMQERQILLVPILRHDDQGGKTWENALPERNVVWLEPSEGSSARRRFHVEKDDFRVILIGKDGGEKLRSQTPVTMERLMKLIDSMPMRQKEVRDGHSGQL
jgi:hypothetical protein